MYPFFNATMCVEHDLNNYFINRKLELSLCINAILSNEKAVLIGERGVGKTALVKQVENILRNEHPEVLPIYLQFSPINFRNNANVGYVYHLLIQLIQYVWTNILGHKLTSLYDEPGSFSDELTEQTQKIHRLTRVATQNQMALHRREMEANLLVKGNISGSNENTDNLNPLSNQEMIGLLSELCDDLIKYTGVHTLAFLCDEANLLTESMQIEIEKDLANIFPTLHCSFLYVASTSALCVRTNLHAEHFERVIHITGFKNIIHSKELLTNRMLQKEKIEIEEEVYALLHKVARGNPRNLISIMSNIVMKKSIDEPDTIAITLKDANLACKDFVETEAIDRKRLQEMHVVLARRVPVKKK